MRFLKRLVVTAGGAMITGACDLDLASPNQPIERQAIATQEGVIAQATGLQGRFAASSFNFAYMAGVAFFATDSRVRFGLIFWSPFW